MRVRFPDSEIRGSTGASPFSRLIAACYVLHRLCAPRHPPDALALTLDRSALMSHAQREAQVSGGKPDSPEWNAIIGSRFVILAGVQTGQPRFHNVKKTQNGIERALRRSRSEFCYLRFRRTYCREGWWSRSGSNRRPQACKARALPTELRPHGKANVAAALLVERAGGPGTS